VPDFAPIMIFAHVPICGGMGSRLKGVLPKRHDPLLPAPLLLTAFGGLSVANQAGNAAL
jgi:hypothetical protein